MDGYDKVAILVDGGFYLKRARYLWGGKSPQERANELHAYCLRHLQVWDSQEDKYRQDILYRIFYYDCPPSKHKPYHPYLDQSVDLSQSMSFRFMTDFLEELRSKRKTALRLGTLLDRQIKYTLPPDTIKELMQKEKSIDDLEEKDFVLNIVQKGVDMRIGLDIASMSYKKQVTKMVLISGDSDFVPAAKLARREGVDFVLDSMKAPVHPALNEHIDGRKSFDTAYMQKTKKQFKPTQKAMPEKVICRPVEVKEETLESNK